ncbi:MAG: UDP-N-acetylmuramoyl-L-alanine--D-glutamate ligase [Candidatus Accumulibacter sp.]|jgi:UDP-N-acetylmuramoylalanine--D-glutamate ligase|nr:UDP-N-acetylmuramoyl-L-alanine--D-glutamate ligase [Accumulibacter sp.]
MELAGKNFLVAGLGESGLAMAKWLHRQGALVRVADSRENPPNREALAAAAPEIEVIAGPFRAETFAAAEVIALSPGVPMATPEIAAAKNAIIVSEVDLFLDAREKFAPNSKVLAITGSNGKTTTTALTAHLLNGAGVAAVACGNISPALLDALMTALDAGQLPRVWVLELSSFQLESTRRFHADAAAVLNISADHLDRHGDMAIYRAVKWRVFDETPIAVLNRDAGDTIEGRRVFTFGLTPPENVADYGLDDDSIWFGGTRLIRLCGLPIKGLHNAANVMAALALCNAVGVGFERVAAALETFKGLPHRVEPVAEIDGVLYIDDSKGTNVGATLAAIEGMGRPVAIILGGEGKGQDFSPLKAALEKHGRAVALIGRDAALIGKALTGRHTLADAKTLAGQRDLPMEQFLDLDTAVIWISQEVQPGDCVLLSPACASFDMFRDYRHRSAVFVDRVHTIRAERS